MPYTFGLIGFSRCAAVCTLAFSLGGIHLAAQSTPATPAQEGSKGTSISPPVGQGPKKNVAPDFRRWGLGGIFSYTPFRLMKGGAGTETTTEGFTATLGSKPQSRPLGGGAEAYFYITRNLSLNLDFIYRRTGYDTSYVLNDALTTSYYSLTRGNYFDFPLLARYESGRYHVLKFPVFVEGGGTLRYVEQITTSTTMNTTVNSALVSDCCTEIADRPAHRAVAGATVGLGLRLPSDEFGVRITPEIRYTRWLENTFNAGPTKSNRDQAEVLISITF